MCCNQHHQCDPLPINFQACCWCSKRSVEPCHGGEQTHDPEHAGSQQPGKQCGRKGLRGLRGHQVKQELRTPAATAADSLLGFTGKSTAIRLREVTVPLYSALRRYIWSAGSSRRETWAYWKESNRRPWRWLRDWSTSRVWNSWESCTCLT